MKTLLLPLVLLASSLLVVPALSQERPKTGADPVAGSLGADIQARTGWRTARGFRWQLLIQDGSGTSAPVDPANTFSTGQAFSIHIEADADLWIYVLNRDPNGEEAVLFPERGEQHLLLRKGGIAILPSSGIFRFSEPAGTETFRIIASSTRLDWVNPRELFELESGESVDEPSRRRAINQRGVRTRNIEKLQEGQPAPTVLEVPLDQAIAGITPERASRRGMRNTVLVAPLPPKPETPDGPAGQPPKPQPGQQVVRVSDQEGDAQPIVYDIPLTHEKR